MLPSVADIDWPNRGGSDGPATSGGRMTVGKLASVGRMGPPVDPAGRYPIVPYRRGPFSLRAIAADMAGLLA